MINAEMDIETKLKILAQAILHLEENRPSHTGDGDELIPAHKLLPADIQDCVEIIAEK